MNNKLQHKFTSLISHLKNTILPAYHFRRDCQVLFKSTSTFFFIAAVLSSCEGGGSPIINDGITARDSVLLQRIDTISIRIGEGIKPIPICSQLIEDSTDTKYIILGDKKLYIFDFVADSLTEIVDVSNCGGLHDYSGFHCAPDGKMYLYNYGNKTFFVVDSNGNVLNSYKIPENILEHVSPEAINGSHIIADGETAIISGLPLNGKTRYYKDDPVSIKINLQTGAIETGASLSDEYSKAFFGGLYFNTIYHCQGDNGKIVYSFPASNYIYRYDKDLCLIDSLYMGSRYTKDIKPSPLSPLEILSDKDKRLNYYLGENSYSTIAYDQLNDFYYRIANHPRVEERTDNSRTPFSIIVMDSVGNLITETTVVEDYYNVIPINCHVYRGGLLLQLKSEVENEIKFVYYKLNS